MKKHIAPISEETHHRAWGFKVACKVKNWDKMMNLLLDLGEEKLKRDLNPSKEGDASNI